MNLTSLIEVAPTNEDSMREFLDANALAHETIYNTLLGVLQITIAHYPLWAPAGVDEDWVHTHAAEHVSIANALGLAVPVDIDEVDFKHPVQAQDWITNHAAAHLLIAEALGL